MAIIDPDELDVSQDMIDAGVAELGRSDMMDWDETVADIWIAMTRVLLRDESGRTPEKIVIKDCVVQGVWPPEQKPN